MGVEVGVLVIVRVGVLVGVAVLSTVGVAVGVRVAVLVGVLVGVGVVAKVGVRVGVLVGVPVWVRVGVAVGMGVTEPQQTTEMDTALELAVFSRPAGSEKTAELAMVIGQEVELFTDAQKVTVPDWVARRSGQTQETALVELL